MMSLLRFFVRLSQLKHSQRTFPYFLHPFKIHCNGSWTQSMVEKNMGRPRILRENPEANFQEIWHKATCKDYCTPVSSHVLISFASREIAGHDSHGRRRAKGVLEFDWATLSWRSMPIWYQSRWVGILHQFPCKGFLWRTWTALEPHCKLFIGVHIISCDDGLQFSTKDVDESGESFPKQPLGERTPRLPRLDYRRDYMTIRFDRFQTCLTCLCASTF